MRVNKRLKLVSVLILFSVLISIAPIIPETIAAGYLNMAACEKTYDNTNPGKNPPAGFNKCITKGSNYLLFNAKLYTDQNVAAYGTAGAANNASDFKPRWEELNGTNHTNKEVIGVHPYYKDDSGTKGEYRYYGWDKLGNLYTNPFFPKDADAGVDADLKKWIYRPWDNSMVTGMSNKPKEFSPFFGTIDTADKVYSGAYETEANKLIKSSYVKVTTQAFSTKSNEMDARKAFNLFDFMYVEQAPSTWVSGQGRMYHKNSNGHVWYQSFAIDALDVGDKKKPGVEGFIIEAPTIGSKDLAKISSNLNYKLKSEIKDDLYVSDTFKKAEYYTRFDIKKWEQKISWSSPSGTGSKTLSSNHDGDLVLQNQKKYALSELNIPLNKSKLKAGDRLEIHLVTTAYYQSPKGLNVFDMDTTDYQIVFGSSIPPPPPPPAVIPDGEPKVLDPPILECKASIPGDAFDIVSFGASDNTDLSRIESRIVTVNGVPIDADLFWSGGYVFGDDADGLVTVSYSWIPKAGEDENGSNNCSSYTLILVHDTKPRAQFQLFGGTFKENRKMSIDNTSRDPNANDPFVQATYPIISSAWSWSALDGASNSDLKMKVDEDDHKEFLYKKTGEYQATLTVTNALGRTSDPYVLNFTVIPDEAPAVILTPYSSQIARGEAVTLYYDAVSTDGDIINNHDFKVYYDVNGNETYTQLVDSFSAPLSQYKPTSNKLGKYRIVATVDENYGQDTIPEFITAADKRKTTRQFEFEIDNYVPYSDIYTDISSMRPQVDTFFLMDKNLAQSKIDYMKGNAVTINNQLRLEGIEPEVNTWDMHTYTFSQSASTVNNTGSYPSSSTAYCSGGYCGTLSLQSTSDNGSYHDFGGPQQVVDVPEHTVNDPWCIGVVRGITYDHPGSCVGIGSPYTRERVVPATYKTVHVPDIRWVSNWYGTYSGTIYKDVRQPYANPFSRTTSDKYVIYISDNTINELADFQKVKGLTDAKIILVGNNTIKTQASSDHFILNSGQAIEDIVKNVVTYIASHNPPSASQTVLINETFKVITDESDPESDPIVAKQTMYVHIENFFDNATGHAPYALSDYNISGYSNETLRTSFAMPGEYKIYRRVKDQPSTDPELLKYSYYSNEAATIVRVHRKPFAQATLDWTYDTNCSCYQTTWVDQSYDLDHNVSDPIAKGIVERKIRYQFGGEWYYQIPDNLAPGAYHLEYIVKDIEGAWSDPFTLDFVLASAPPPQLRASLRSTDNTFTITGGVPITENLTAFELWTRFPLSVGLQLTMGTYMNKTVPYYTGTKSGSTIEWADVTASIPANMPDGMYTFRVVANGSNNTSAHKDFSVKVHTPINLVPVIRDAEGKPTNTIVVGNPFTLAASTTEYPHQVTVTAFKGNAFQRSINLASTTTSTSGTGSKQWSIPFTAAGVIPDGAYTFEWTAQTPNGNIETKSVQVQLINNTPPFGDFKVYTYDQAKTTMPIYEGDLVHIRSVGIGDNEHDSLTIRYELLDPSGVKRHDESFNSLYPYHPSGPDFHLPNGAAATGAWTIRQTISDGKAAPVMRTKSIQVLPLGIQGYVRHTDAWEANRLHYNEKNPTAPRPANWFWAGEAFVLEAGVTNTGTSETKPVSVVAQAVSSSALRKSLAAITGNPTQWAALLREGDTSLSFEELPEGDYSFVFTVTFSNGTVKSSAIPIRIQATVDNYVQVHRLQ